MMKIFNMIGIGERVGSGVPDIFSVWESQGWIAPEFKEQFNPDRTILKLSFIEKQAEKTNRNGQTSKTIENKRQIMNYLATEGTSRAADIAEHIKLSLERTRVLLSELTNDGKMQTEGSGRTRRYLQKKGICRKKASAEREASAERGLSQNFLHIFSAACRDRICLYL